MHMHHANFSLLKKEELPETSISSVIYAENNNLYIFTLFYNEETSHPEVQVSPPHYSTEHPNNYHKMKEYLQDVFFFCHPAHEKLHLLFSVKIISMQSISSSIHISTHALSILLCASGVQAQDTPISTLINRSTWTGCICRAIHSNKILGIYAETGSIPLSELTEEIDAPLEQLLFSFKRELPLILNK
ncbi:hypothetical protein NEFER03_1585 [Nematocida sp. LUAm3]|nr:hypothetical protein NEFER03_1585 [Nematocida sp. LUAm3]KAI5176384.1 hypothetical protein NEFER02_2158 [Nematocida sp. LUAm2]KAI5179044.1 hypothetical protein NEFER01_1920 [Nematocida sp. LUAm1]